MKDDNTVTSNDTLVLRDARFLMPINWKWEPKEDITAHEIALCIPWLFTHYWEPQMDYSAPHFRHFIIHNPNKP